MAATPPPAPTRGLAIGCWTSSGLPAAASEVRELHRGRARGHRHLAERRWSTQGRRVVHVHVGGQPAAHAVDEPPAHHVVHPAVAALAGGLLELRPERVLVALLPLLEASPLVLALPGVLEEDAGRIAPEDSLGPGHEVDAVVGAGVGHVVLEQDGPALGGLDEAGVHVAAVVLLLPLRG